MAKVAGQLIDVTASPSLVVSVRVRARRVRVCGGDVVTGEGAQVPVEDGRVSFTCLSGPAVLTLERAGVPAEVVPLVVPEQATVSLGACVEAARLADGGERDALERLAGEAAGAADSAGASASKAEEHAGEASSSAVAAQLSESDANNSARLARSYSSAARDSADKASMSASEAASSASDAKASAAAASTAASQAEVSADRADRIATSTSWSGDKLTVNGKTSPPLTGPRGPMGRVEDHTHPITEVDGLQYQLDVHKARLDSYGETFKLVALREELVALRAELEAVRARPALWSGEGTPPSSIPGARVGDWWLDETSMDLHQITGV